MKKLYQRLEKKIVTILNKQITISAVIWIIIGVMIVNIVVTNSKSGYSYIDMNNNNGTSNNCYQTKNELRCNTSIQVKQYFKD